MRFAARDMSRYHDEYEGADSMRALAIAVFRAALHALPASARAWFGDLRDRGLAASVEVGLHGHHSPRCDHNAPSYVL